MITTLLHALKRAFARPRPLPCRPQAEEPARRTPCETTAAMRAGALELRRTILDIRDWDLKHSMSKVATATDAMAAIVAADPARERDAWPVLDSSLPRTRAVLRIYLGLERTPRLSPEDATTLAEVRLTLIGMTDVFENHLNALRGASLLALTGRSEALGVIGAYDAPPAKR